MSSTAEKNGDGVADEELSSSEGGVSLRGICELLLMVTRDLIGITGPEKDLISTTSLIFLSDLSATTPILWLTWSQVSLWFFSPPSAALIAQALDIGLIYKYIGHRAMHENIITYMSRYASYIWIVKIINLGFFCSAKTNPLFERGPHGILYQRKTTLPLEQRKSVLKWTKKKWMSLLAKFNINVRFKLTEAIE